jgi:hypothetical protein
MLKVLQIILICLCAAAAHFSSPLPADVTDVEIITLPDGATLRYKKHDICDTAKGGNSFSGYIDISHDKHLFFWFVESRNNPASDPITLFLAGGPGSDSMPDVFSGVGPCNFDFELWLKERKFEWPQNPHSWNGVSNMLFLSQPVGVGFSYAWKEVARFSLAGQHRTPWVDEKNGTMMRLARANYSAIGFCSSSVHSV